MDGDTPLRTALIIIVLWVALTFLCVELEIPRARSIMWGEMKLVKELAAIEPEDRDRILRGRCEVFRIKVKEGD